jgi:hypothetical protein
VGPLVVAAEVVVVVAVMVAIVYCTVFGDVMVIWTNIELAVIWLT